MIDETKPSFDIAKADYKARCWVQGSKKYKLQDGSDRWDPIVASFHERFIEHPWVREAVSEGWDRDLRGHIVAAVSRHLLDGGTLAQLRVENLMPSRYWIDYAKRQAGRGRSAAEWRADIVARYGDVDAYLGKTVSQRGQTFKQAKPPSHIIAPAKPKAEAHA